MVQVALNLWGAQELSGGDFDKLWQLPAPVQKRIPVNFGLGVASARNFARIAELGDGWYPLEQDPDQLALQVTALQAAFAARNRDPATATIRMMIRPF